MAAPQEGYPGQGYPHPDPYQQSPVQQQQGFPARRREAMRRKHTILELAPTLHWVGRHRAEELFKPPKDQHMAAILNSQKRSQGMVRRNMGLQLERLCQEPRLQVMAPLLPMAV
jgi:hypothetical protein